MKSYGLALSLVLASGVQAAEIAPYIVNGSAVDLTNYPSFSSLYYDDDTQYGNMCGATIINSQYVLTAAHCLFDSSTNLPSTDTMRYMWVVPQLVDENNYLTSAPQKVRVSEFYYPSTYSNNIPRDGLPDDIAILKLKSPLSLPESDLSYLIDIQSSENDTYTTMNQFIAIGHGYERNNGGFIVVDGNQLLQTELTLKATGSCAFGYGLNTTNKQLCFDGAQGAIDKNSTCNGDSGGPVYGRRISDGKYYQIGITSFGPSRCGDPSASYTSVFTEVYDYRGWINNVLNGTEDPKYRVEITNSSTSVIEVASSSTA